MVAAWEFVFGELGFVVYAGKVFEFGFEWGFWVWLEREAFEGEAFEGDFFFLVKVEVFFSEMERPGGGL